MMSAQRQITFFINDKHFHRKYGTTVKQAIIAYDQRVLREIRRLRAWVVDGRGSRVGLGGTLENGVHLYIRYVSEEINEDS
jgi:hypothetical protein